MTNNRYPEIKQLIINVFQKCTHLQTLKECRQKFMVSVFTCFSSIKGKINFLQMSRFSDKCEQYFRINFENKFNFQDFNLSMMLANVLWHSTRVTSKKVEKRPLDWACTGRVVPAGQNGVWTSVVLQ